MNIIKNYEEFQEIIKQELVILIAKTKACVVCKPLSEKLESFMKEYDKIPYYEIFLEDAEVFSGQHLVFTVPTVLVFSNSNEILRESRFINFDKIKRLFDLYLEK